MLNKRDILYEKAKESVRCSSTFSFKKGKSRSALQANKQNVPEKRKYTSESSREEHIAKLFEDIDGKQKQVKYKVLHQTKAQVLKDWRLQGEINILKKEIYSLQQELKCFQRKQQKSKWFKKKKGSCANTKEHQGTSDQPTLRQSIDRLKKKGEAVEEVNQENPIGGDNSEVEECEASNSEVEECDVSTNDKAEECEVSNNEVEECEVSNNEVKECQLDNNEAEENRSSGKDFL